MSVLCSTAPIEAAFPLRADHAGPSLSSKQEAFERTVMSHHDQFVWAARRLTPFREDAEDIVQESLLRAFRKLAEFRGEAKMSTWIQAIIRNTARDWLRRQRGCLVLSLEHIRNQDDDSGGFDVYDPASSPEDAASFNELEGIMLEEVGKLSDRYRSAITMCQLGEMPQAEAASRFNVSVMTVKSRIFKAKASIRRSMSRAGTLSRQKAGAAIADMFHSRMAAGCDGLGAPSSHASSF